MLSAVTAPTNAKKPERGNKQKQAIKTGISKWFLVVEGRLKLINYISKIDGETLMNFGISR